MIEKLKHIPIPIWIGLGLVIIVVLFLSSSSSKQQAQQAPPVTAPTGPVTGATVGTQGLQAGAGTDQELANLSQITQGGFAQIQHNETIQTGLLTNINSRMTGIGTPMQQFGGAIQGTQTGAAQNNATASASGQPVQNAGNSDVSSMVPTSVHG